MWIFVPIFKTQNSRSKSHGGEGQKTIFSPKKSINQILTLDSCNVSSYVTCTCRNKDQTVVVIIFLAVVISSPLYLKVEDLSYLVFSTIKLFAEMVWSGWKDFIFFIIIYCPHFICRLDNTLYLPQEQNLTC